MIVMRHDGHVKLPTDESLVSKSDELSLVSFLESISVVIVSILSLLKIFLANIKRVDVKAKIHTTMNAFLTIFLTIHLCVSEKT